MEKNFIIAVIIPGLARWGEYLTPADVYFGKKEQILRRRERIKTQNMTMRRALYASEKLNNN
jgi:hypothetical protein